MKVCAFIDSQNLNLSVRNSLKGKNDREYYTGWKLDFAKFFIYLKDKYKVEKVFIFIGYVAGNEALYTKLQKAGYLLIFKPTLEYKKGNKIIIKGNVDAELVMHTMIEFKKYEKAIIVAGDGDYHCLIELISKL
ncbi:TPA: hypothetical protein DIV55_01095, partial [Patescibacteria group bacterium]|nr:hypothetical protein [Patescibacteria group bacterium]